MNVREYRFGDDEKIVSLLMTVFPGWPRLNTRTGSSDHWKWKYSSRVFDKKIIGVIEEDNVIVAVVHSVPNILKLYSDEVPACLGGDVAVHPNYRKKGYWEKTLDATNEARVAFGVQYLYNVTGNPIVFNFFKKRENYLEVPFPLANYVLIDDIDLQLEKIPMDIPFVKLGYSLMKLVNHLFQKGHTVSPNVNIIESDLFPDEINDFYNEVSKNYDYIIRRDQDYLNWRFCDSRGGSYKIYTAMKEGKIIGYLAAIINEFNREYPVGYISDLLVLDGEEDAGIYLVQHALKYFKERDVNIVNFLAVRGSQNERIIRRNEFLNSKIKIGLFYSYLSNSKLKDLIEKIDPKRVHISWSDTDTLPVKLGS